MTSHHNVFLLECADLRFMDGEFNLKDLGSTTGTFFYLRPHGGEPEIELMRHDMR